MITHTNPSNIHSQLGNDFFEKAIPAKFPKHILRFINNRAAKSLNFEKIELLSNLSNLT